MQLLEGIKKFKGEVGVHYSISNKLSGDCDYSIYNELYDLYLCHLLESEADHIKARLRTILNKSDHGILQENTNVIGGVHKSDYLSLHMTSMYCQLAETYMPESPALEYFDNWNEQRLYKKLETYDHSNSWYLSNILMSYATLFAFNINRGSSEDSLHSLMRYIDSLQDRKCGLWLGNRKRSLLNGMAAAFHYLPAYEFTQHKLSYAAKMFDSILKLTLPGGFFSCPSGYACLDYDGISSLEYLATRALTNKELESRIEKLIYLAKQLHSSLLGMQQSDGGFPEIGPSRGAVSDLKNLIICLGKSQCFWTIGWNAKFTARIWLNPNRKIYANSVESCSSNALESNAFATWFRYMTISSCENILERFDNLTHRYAPPRKLSLPGLAFF